MKGAPSSSSSSSSTGGSTPLPSLSSTASVPKPYMIGGVQVRFPFTPYGGQLALMAKLIAATTRAEHALLESPTGSGKTLALLCSSLAFQEKWASDAKRGARMPMDKNAVPKMVTDPNASSSSAPKPGGRVMSFSSKRDPAKLAAAKEAEAMPRIYFGSRTHSQLAQVVKELRATTYRPKMTILASREHYCIHPTVSRSSSKNDDCVQKQRQGRPCGYFHAAPRLKAHPTVMNVAGQPEVWDIEDLVRAGRDMHACPFYGSRTLHGEESTTMVLCPYNYLIDPVIRSSMPIDLENAIVILDEAHNIESVSRDAASQEFDMLEVKNALGDLTRQLQERVNNPNPVYVKLHTVVSNLHDWMADRVERRVQNGPSASSSPFERSSSSPSTNLSFFDIKSRAPPQPARGRHQKRRKLPEDDVIGAADGAALLESCGITPATLGALRQAYTTACEEAAAADQQRRPGAGSKGGSSSSSNSNPPPGPDMVLVTSTLSVLERVLVVSELFIGDGTERFPGNKDSYKLAMITRERQKNAINQLGASRRKNKQPVLSLVDSSVSHRLAFWCLNPAVAFTEVRRAARSVVLTSGTLSPLDSFASELGCAFRHRLEASHVIKPDQVRVTCVPRSVTGVAFNASYRNTRSLTFQDATGEAVIQLCRTIPQGVLVFFPSYGLLNTLYSRWNNTGVIQRLQQVKAVFTEPRSAGTKFDRVVKRFKKGVLEQNGAVFFAVCRGKLSEGIDFADELARAVIMIGVPYPAMKSTQVQLKRNYNDHRSKTERGTLKPLSGSAWYSLQAYRALNQAVGRCIRHRLDYGAIILLDDRFLQTNIQKNLTRWVRRRLDTSAAYDPQAFKTELEQLGQFFARWQKEPPSVRAAKEAEVARVKKEARLKQERAKQEEVKLEQAKQQQVKQEQVKQEQAKQQHVKQEQVKQEPKQKRPHVTLEEDEEEDDDADDNDNAPPPSSGSSSSSSSSSSSFMGSSASAKRARYGSLLDRLARNTDSVPTFSKEEATTHQQAHCLSCKHELWHTDSTSSTTVLQPMAEQHELAVIVSRFLSSRFSAGLGIASNSRKLILAESEASLVNPINARLIHSSTRQAASPALVDWSASTVCTCVACPSCEAFVGLRLMPLQAEAPRVRVVFLASQVRLSSSTQTASPRRSPLSRLHKRGVALVSSQANASPKRVRRVKAEPNAGHSARAAADAAAKANENSSAASEDADEDMGVPDQDSDADFVSQ